MAQKYADNKKAINDIELYLNNNEAEFSLLKNITCKRITFIECNKINISKQAVLKDAEITKTIHAQQNSMIHKNIVFDKLQQNNTQLDYSVQKEQKPQHQQSDLKNLQQIIKTKLPGVQNMQQVNNEIPQVLINNQHLVQYNNKNNRKHKSTLSVN